MKKLFSFILIVMVGIFLSANFLFADDNNRTITKLSGSAPHANTVISAKGVVLYKIMGRAFSASAVYAIYDSPTIALAGSAGYPIMVEGGEATQYDTLELIDFGTEGLSFINGLTIITTTADVVVIYS